MPPKAKSQFGVILKIKNFMVFAISQSVSIFGDNLDHMALLAMIAFFVPAHTRSLAISRLTVVLTLPAIIFGPFAGVLVDRWNRRKVLIVCDTFRAILVALIPVMMLWTKNIYSVYALIFLVFLFGLFFNSARLSIIPNLVARRRLLAANSFVSFIGRFMTLLGIFIGGIMVDWSFWHKRLGIPGFSAGFYLDSLSYFVSVICLSLMVVRLKQRKRQEFQPGEGTILGTVGRKFSRTFHEFKDGFRLIRHTPAIVFTLLSILLLMILSAGVFVLFVPIIQSELNLGTRGVGFVGAIGSIGLVFSSVLFGIFGHRWKTRFVITGGFAIVGAALILFALARSFLPIIPLTFIVGFVAQPIMICQDTLLQEHTPEEARGRIFALKEWSMQVTFALSAFLIGLVSGLSKRGILGVIGVLAIALSVLAFFITRNKKFH
jgi:MFS family permease